MKRGYRRRRSRNVAVAAGAPLPSARLHLFGVGVICLSVFIVLHLFDVMILQHGFYANAATRAHEITASLQPNRGAIYIGDHDSVDRFPVAINHRLYLVYLDNRYIIPEDQDRIVDVIAKQFAYDASQITRLREKLAKEDDPYEPIEKDVTEEIVQQLKKERLPGVGFILSPKRFYPEHDLVAHIIGFVGKNNEGEDVGRYGIEGYWGEELSGSGGYYAGARSAAGKWIPLAGKLFQPAIDGADITLTIDRTLQAKACQILAMSVERYSAKSGTLVITDPSTGAVRAMCTVPTFDANAYNVVSDVTVYNNDAIFTPYEPGSIFKPIVMAAALNEHTVAPGEPFYDTGIVTGGDCDKPIKNAAGKAHHDTNIRGIIEQSINTGMVHVAERLGKNRVKSYIEQFGFGTKTGIELDTEVAGNIGSLSVHRGDRFDCYTATASFGQGITVTPLQMAMAFGVFANGGVLKRPYIVDRVEMPDGKVKHHTGGDIRRVLTPRAAATMTDMLEGVINQGQAKKAQVKGYRLAGKTGTAQIAEGGRYSEDSFNHSFVGFGPVEKPSFVMVVKLEEPNVKYSSESAAPTFGEIANFLLRYYRVPPSS